MPPPLLQHGLLKLLPSGTLSLLPFNAEISGWDNGKTRMDVVIICGHNQKDLRRLALEIAMQIEAVARNWEVLICGRQLKSQSSSSRACRIQCPRMEAFSTTHVQATSKYYFPLSKEDVAAAVAYLEDGWSLDDVAAALGHHFETKLSRCVYYNEVRSELQKVTPLPRSTGQTDSPHTERYRRA